MNILEIKGVSKSYAKHQALTDISFSIPENSVFGLLGPNGAGKTTLIRIITNIIMADQGQVLFKGEPLTPDMVRQIGYLPEERGLYKKMKVADQLLYLARLKGMSKSDAVASIKSWLKKFEITSWINKNIEDLSKGMQQKIQFIATVMHNPSLIILDEPFSGFDPINANLIKDEILELREKGATIIFSTHRMESVEELCDDIALIHNASVVLNGAKKDIKNQYRTNTYLVDYEGKVSFADTGCEILSEQTNEEGITQSEVKIKGSVNDLVGVVTQHASLVSLNEKVPSINEIFISQVNTDHHE
ncbi:MAG: ABC transporter ATP-binding protein [Reichenbachiella sp.]